MDQEGKVPGPPGPAKTSSVSDSDNVAAGVPPEGKPAGGARWLIIGGGLLGALAAWGLINAFENFFDIPQEIASKIGVHPDIQERVDAGEISGGEVIGLMMQRVDMRALDAEVTEANRQAALKNNALAIGLLGLALCGFLGLSAGIARRSALLALVGLAIGTLLGAALGAAAGLAEMALAERLRTLSGLDQTLQTALAHAVAWGLVGVAAGVSSGAITRRSREIIRYVCAGGLSGVAAPFLFAPIAALLFPMDKTDLAVPGGTWSRLLWILIGSGLISLSLALSNTGKTRKAGELSRKSLQSTGE